VRGRLLNPRLLFLVLALYLVLSTCYVAYRGIVLIDRFYRYPGNDFEAFYSAGRQVVSSGRSHLYDQSPSGRALDRTDRNYFNPPALALLLAPLVRLPLYSAKNVMTVLTLVSAAGLLWLSARWRRRTTDLLLADLALASFWPMYAAIHLGQPSMLFALVAAGSIVLLDPHRSTPSRAEETGERRERASRAAGWLASLLVFKPSIAAAHMAVVAIHGRRPALTAIVLGSLLLGLAPFLLLGGHAFDAYVNLISESRRDAFRLAGEVTAGAGIMFNWNGFVAHLFARSPNPVAVYALDFLTIALMLRVWLRGRLIESWLAAALATNLAVPHLVYYDALLLLAPAFAFAMGQRSPGVVALLAATHLAVNVSMLQIYDGGFPAFGRQDIRIYAATPAMMLLLATLASDRLRALIETPFGAREESPAPLSPR
jgi:hypothetical protein